MSDEHLTGEPDEIIRRPMRPKTEDAERQPNSGGAAKPAKRVSLPSLDEVDARMEYASHRADLPEIEPTVEPDEEPADDAIEPHADLDIPHDDIRALLSDAGIDEPDDTEKELSSGFILGIALVIIVLVFGLVMARMHGRINALESRVLKLEGPAPSPPPAL